MTDRLETATFGAGCFWCVEEVYRELRGVRKVVSGYSGGKTVQPTYQQVCTGMTGHAESVQVTYDPDAVSYAELLEVFWTIHDPTTLNRQGDDVGTQYRSVIFCHDEKQTRIAEESRRREGASGHWASPVVTEIVPFEAFFPAEDYHQSYFRQNPEQQYCRLVVRPKVAKFQMKFPDRLNPA